MSEISENATEQTTQEGVELMSIKDALTFVDSGEKTTVEPINKETVEAETPQEEEIKVEEPKKDVVEEVKDVIEPKEDAKVEKTPIETVKDPNEDLYDDEDREYFAFKKANKGATRADFKESKVDYDALDRKDLLRKSLREKYGIKDSDEELNSYIETELNIPMDVNESEMSLSERVALRKLTDEYVNSKKEQQKKWLEGKSENIAQKEQEEMVTLENGQKMSKKEHDKIVNSRNNYLKGNEEALNRVNATSIKIEIDDNGSKREVEYNYEFSKEDKHRMLSISSDPVAHFNKTYATENGWNHSAINENQAWSDTQLRGKMLKSMLQTARAEGFEESLKEQGNITIGSNKGLPKQETKGVKYVPLSELFNK